jgi:hypothetical protein
MMGRVLEKLEEISDGWVKSEIDVKWLDLV